MGSRAFVILLPPSEGKADGGDPAAEWDPADGVFGGALADSRRQVVMALAKTKGGSEKLLGVSGKHLQRAKASNSALIGAPTLPAWQRYTGVVWDHLDLASMSAADRRSATTRIVVPSGLAGLVRGDDPLPDYRLKMGARLAPLGTMARWWQPAVTEALRSVARGRTVVDLLPNEHRAAIDWAAIDDVVRIDLVSRTGGAVGGHNAKAAKGLLARHLLSSKDVPIARSLASFTHPEYSAKART